jgi:hypothetical protein
MPSADDLALAREILANVLQPGLHSRDMGEMRDAIAAIIANHRQPPDSRRTITLCGSTRFKRAWLEWNARLTLAGNVVFSVAMWSHDVRIEPTEEQKITLDEIHKAKIDRSNEIFVLDVGGYIGSSTRSEIEHAERTGKPVRYLSREFPEWTEDDCVYASNHRQPAPPLTDAERKERIEKTLDCELVDLFTCPSRPSLDELRVENERLREALMRIREWDMLDACDDGPWCKSLIDLALTPKGPTP